MGIRIIDGNTLKNMVIAGANSLAKRKQLVDSLNVFPVPDGDTGTNMSLTVLAAAREVEKLNTPNIYDVAKAASNGSLRGARGNSGVILSQLFRGFAKSLSGKSLASAEDLAMALVKAQETAYKAIMKPKEGTILTIAKALASKATELSYENDDIMDNFEKIYNYSMDVLDKTTEMLPELKQAGVVDAGGKGLLCFMEGAFEALKSGKEYKIESHSESSSVLNNAFANINTEDIKFAYCTELFVNLEKENEKIEDIMKNYLTAIGDSIVVVCDEKIVKIHVHTNNPGSVLEKSLTLGSLSNIKIENMKEQHTNIINFSGQIRELPKIKQEEKEYGFVTVSLGAGFKELFVNLGADEIIEGGQTMNPSTEDILSAIEKINAKNIFILPNNKNIIMAAEQAKILSNKNVLVLRTKTIPEGVSAMINFVNSMSLEENIETMTNAFGNLTTGQVTYAVRTTKLDDRDIEEGDMLCMINGKINNTAKDVQEGTKVLLDSLINDESSLVSIYFGEDVQEEDADELTAYINEKYPDCEVEVYSGGQPLYYYLISAE